MSCVDLNECTGKTHNCQQTCTNTQGSFTCSCDVGFTPSNAATVCTNIDECARNISGCEQICTDTFGSFQCSCRSGFTVNGSRCLDINEVNLKGGGGEE